PRSWRRSTREVPRTPGVDEGCRSRGRGSAVGGAGTGRAADQQALLDDQAPGHGEALVVSDAFEASTTERSRLPGTRLAPIPSTAYGVDGPTVPVSTPSARPEPAGSARTIRTFG